MPAQDAFFKICVKHFQEVDVPNDAGYTKFYESASEMVGKFFEQEQIRAMAL